jgi:peptide/nickel transport system substrate-binding protein
MLRVNLILRNGHIGQVFSFLIISCLVLSGSLSVVLTLPSSSALQSSATGTTTTTNNGTLKLTLVGIPTTLNEINASESIITDEICASCWQIMQLEYASGMPVLQDGYNNTKAGLFDWFSSNSNATVWDFNIRPGATWSNGTPITSSDVNFTFSIPQVLFTLWTRMSKYVIPTITSLGSLHPPIKSIKVINSSETQFTLLASYATFGAVVSSQYFFAPLPMHVWQSKSVTKDLNFAQDVSSGPFYHLNYTKGSSVLILKQNPYYWDKSNISEIIVTFVSIDSDAAASLLQEGFTNLALISPANATSFVGKSNFGLDVEPDRGLLYLGYNVTSLPFNTPGFREAIADSINTSYIAQSVYDGYATPGFKGEGLIPPSATMWYNTSGVEYQYNLALAAKNLTSLGYKTVGGKLEYSNGSSVKFTVYTDTNNSADYDAAQIVQSDLSALNMSVNVISEPMSHLVRSFAYASGNTTSELVVASTQLPLFGVGFVDVLPAYENYLPWSPYLEYATYDWLSPQNIETEYNNLFVGLNSSTNPTNMRDTVIAIDGLNAQYLPMIPLAYPDQIWAYDSANFTGFPTSSNSAEGFDMGALALDPTTFSSITATCAPNCPQVNATPPPNSTSSSSSTTSAASSSSTTTTTPTSTPPNNSDLLLVIAIIVVIALIAAATFIARRGKGRGGTAP